MLPGHMFLGTCEGTLTSVALRSDVFLVFILQAGDWAKVSTPS